MKTQVTLLAATLHCPISFTGEGWKRQALQPSYRYNATMARSAATNSAGMWVMVSQHQNTGPPGSKVGLYRFMGSRSKKTPTNKPQTKKKKKRLQGQGR